MVVVSYKGKYVQEVLVSSLVKLVAPSPTPNTALTKLRGLIAFSLPVSHSVCPSFIHTLFEGYLINSEDYSLETL